MWALQQTFKQIVQSFLSLLAVTILFCLLSLNYFLHPTSALTYSEDIGVSFTFNPMLRLTLSSADLSIYDLAPGSSADSNTITINVLTNTTNGYTLNASVGNNSTYNTRNLALAGGTNNEGITSVAYGTSYVTPSDLPSSNSNWAYAYLDEDDGHGGTNTTWSSYSGLPLYSDTTNIATLRTTTTPVLNSTGDNIKFKIAAKALSNQAAGTYTNVINFTLVATPVPTTLSDAFSYAGKEKLNGYYKLQDMNSEICNNTEVVDEGSQMQAIDIRDHHVYWITKLQDGHCWMTQNLDFNIDENTTYTSLDTDLTDHSLTGAYSAANGYSYDSTNDIISWTPERSTIDARSGTITGWENDNYIPFSVDPGDWYAIGEWASQPATYCDYLATSCTYFAQSPYATNGTHGHVGNYYSWSAAIAANNSEYYNNVYGPIGDGSTFTDISYNPQNSVCPAGWRLPTISSDSADTNNSTNEFARLNLLYNDGLTDSGVNLLSAPIFITMSGYSHTDRIYAGTRGVYISSTVANDLHQRYPWIAFDMVDPDRLGGDRYAGHTIRCVAR